MACSNCGQVVEVGGDVGMVRAVGPLVDRQRPPHQRLGLGQAVRGLQQRRQVVEVAGDVGMVRAVATRSSIASARRISGSASASRLVACSSGPGC